jgi:hypothetical protein
MNTLTRMRLWARRPTQPSPYRRSTPMLLESMGRAIWRTLESIGQRRAARELLAAAERYASSNPALARLLRESAEPVSPHVREAAEVRAMADRYRRIDPGFASDLYGAADRHERLGDEAAAGKAP